MRQSAKWHGSPSEGGTHRFALTRSNVRLDGDIAVDPPQPAGALLVSRHEYGELFFQIADAAPSGSGHAPPVRGVALLWDRSLSRTDDDLEKEIALVRLRLVLRAAGLAQQATLDADRGARDARRPVGRPRRLLGG